MASQGKDPSTAAFCNESHVKTSILLLCGLPGSGKSTLASSIVQYYETQNGKGVQSQSPYFHKVVKIEYDAITLCLSEKYGKADVKNDEQASDDFSSQDLEAWRETRTEALRLLQIEMSTAAGGTIYTKSVPV